MPSDPLLNELATPLGHLVIEFNYLEVVLAITISRVIRTDDLVGSTLAPLSFTAKLDLFGKLAEQRLNERERRDDVRGFIKRARKVNDERNRYINGEYAPILDGSYAYVGMAHRPARDLMGNFKDVTPQQLEMLADQVRSLAADLRVFSGTMYDMDPH